MRIFCTTGGSPSYEVFSTADPITMISGLCTHKCRIFASVGGSTVPLTHILCKSQNLRKAGTFCNYLVHVDFIHADFSETKQTHKLYCGKHLVKMKGHENMHSFS